MSNLYTFGENGTLEYAPDAISDKLLLMFFKMVRNTDINIIQTLFNDNIIAMQGVKLEERVMMATNLIKLCYLTRSCRGGKGERTLFEILFELLTYKFPYTMKNTLHLIPYYGYWKDVFVLIKRNNLSYDMVNSLLDLVSSQLRKDIDSSNPSLLAKWLPRENKKLYEEVSDSLKKNGMKSLIREIMNRYDNKISINQQPKTYRLLIQKIISKCKPVETYMCDGMWADIKFKMVPSLAMQKYNHAFDLTNYKLEPTTDRLLCKEHYVNFLVNGKVNGAQVEIDKLVEKVFNRTDNVSFEELNKNGPYDLLLAHKQFESYVEYVKQQLLVAQNEARKNLANNEFKFNPTDCEVMIDVSGSMNGQPMYAAIGLGMLIMSLNKNNKSFLTFHEKPSYVNISDCTTFSETVSRIKNASWGGSTNFIEAFKLMLAKSGNNIKNAKKTLIVLSDMQFNNAVGENYQSFYGNNSSKKTVDKWEPMYNTICNMWKEWYGLNEDNCLPTIIFWNLRGDIYGVPVKSDIKGVTQISGYSGSLFKMVLFGEELKEQYNNEKPTPSQVLARTLNAKEYDPVKLALGWYDNKLYNNKFTIECENL